MRKFENSGYVIGETVLLNAAVEKLKELGWLKSEDVLMDSKNPDAMYGLTFHGHDNTAPNSYWWWKAVADNDRKCYHLPQDWELFVAAARVYIKSQLPVLERIKESVAGVCAENSYTGKIIENKVVYGCKDQYQYTEKELCDNLCILKKIKVNALIIDDVRVNVTDIEQMIDCLHESYLETETI